MYTQNFELDEDTFSLTPLVSTYRPIQRSEEAITLLKHSIESDDGHTMIVGDVGTGKTLICKKIIDHYADNDKVKTVHISNPLMSRDQLIAAIYNSLPEEGRVRVDDNFYQAFRDYAVQHGKEDNRILILIDEAHLLSLELIESLRLLANIELLDKKVVHIAFFAQPEICATLKKPELRPLMQRLTHYFNLSNFTENESEYYIKTATNGKFVFDDKSIKRIHKLAYGNPRSINILSKRALLAAYTKGKSYISVDEVNMAYKELVNLTSAKSNRYVQMYKWVFPLMWIVPIVILCVWTYVSWGL